MSKEINVVLLEPGKKAVITQIENSLDSMQEIVGGLIQVIWPFPEPYEDICIICNDEGKLLHMPANRPLYNPNEGTIYDIVCGSFFICNGGSEGFESLNHKELDYFYNFYMYPQDFFKVGSEIMAFDYDPDYWAECRD